MHGKAQENASAMNKSFHRFLCSSFNCTKPRREALKGNLIASMISPTLNYKCSQMFNVEIIKHITCNDGCFNRSGSAIIQAESTETWPESPDPSSTLLFTSVCPLIVTHLEGSDYSERVATCISDITYKGTYMYHPSNPDC